MNNGKELRVVSFSAKNVYGIEELAIQPNGRGVLIKARNAKRKTSLLQAMLATVGGGSLSSLTRVGPDGKAVGEPETTMVLDGPGGQVRIRKSKGTAQVERQVGTSAAFEIVGQPQSWLDSIFDSAAANPVELLQAKDKELAILILESLPLNMDRDAFEAILTEISDIWERPYMPTGLHPLEEIALVHKAVFTTRTGVRTNLDGKKNAADQTLRNAPAVLPGDPVAEIAKREAAAQADAASIAAEEVKARAEWRGAEQAAESARDAEEARVVSAFKVEAGKLRAAHDRQGAEIRAEAERRISDLKLAVDAEIETLNERGQAERTAAYEQCESASEAARLGMERALAATQGRRQALQADLDALATLRAQSDAAKKAAQLHQLAKQFRDEAEALKTEHTRLTAALEAINTYRLELAKGLPVEGLEIMGNVVRVDGVAWPQVNQARRVEIAAKIALARSGPLRLLFLDGLESLDSENRNALLDYLMEHGAQPFGAMVTDDPQQQVQYLGAMRHVEEPVGAGA